MRVEGLLNGTPFSRRYWLGTVDARPLALFRIGLGALVLYDIADRLRDFRVFYTDGGILPRALLATIFPDLKSALAMTIGAPWQAGLLFALGAAAALLVMLGWYARPALVVQWIYLLVIADRQPLICDGSDDVLIVMTFWALFADVDAAWSLRRGARRARVPAFPVRLLELQVALIYLTAGLDKHGHSWRDGTALYLALQSNDFARPLGMTLLAHPNLCRLLSYSALATELAFAPLVLAPRPHVTRAIAAALATGLHLGIVAFMSVGNFSAAMMVSLCLYVPPSLLGRRAIAPDDVDAPLPHRSRMQRRLSAALALVFLATVVLALAPRRAPMWLRTPLFHLGLMQKWNMFSPEGVQVDRYFASTGRLADGTTIDPLARHAPAMLPGAPLRFSRWIKLRSSVANQDELPPLLLRWLCQEQQSPKLVEATLRSFERHTHRPDDPPGAFQPVIEARWVCR